MDRRTFDTLTRRFASYGSRRAALAALLGAAATLPASSSLRAGNRKGKGKKKGGDGHVLVCHSGETLRAPRYAVRAIKLAGGSVGACPPEAPPPGSGAGTCVREFTTCQQGEFARVFCSGDGCGDFTRYTIHCPNARRCANNADCGRRQSCDFRLNGCCGPQPPRQPGLCLNTCEPPNQ